MCVVYDHPAVTGPNFAEPPTFLTVTLCWTRRITSEALKLFINPQGKFLGLTGHGTDAERDIKKGKEEEKEGKRHSSHVWFTPTFRPWLRL